LKSKEPMDFILTVEEVRKRKFLVPQVLALVDDRGSPNSLDNNSTNQVLASTNKLAIF